MIGAETVNLQGIVIPKCEWVENIVRAAGITGNTVFMKESLGDLMGDDFWQAYSLEVEQK